MIFLLFVFTLKAQAQSTICGYEPGPLHRVINETILSHIPSTQVPRIPDLNPPIKIDNPELYDTSKKYKINGVYTTERQTLHDAIFEKYFSKAPSASSDPRLIFMAGAPGSGKSYVVQILKKLDILTNDYWYIDADEILEDIPEYKKFQTLDLVSAAALVHKESTDIRDRIIMEALKKKISVIMDGTFSAVTEARKVVDFIHFDFWQYTTSIIFVDAKLETLIERVKARGAKTGRYVPTSVIKLKKEGSATAVKNATPLMNAVYIIDNEITPTVTEIFVNGRNKTTIRIPLDNNIRPSQVRYLRQILKTNYKGLPPVSHDEEIRKTLETQPVNNELTSFLVQPIDKQIVLLKKHPELCDKLKKAN